MMPLDQEKVKGFQKGFQREDPLVAKIKGLFSSNDEEKPDPVKEALKKRRAAVSRGMAGNDNDSSY